MEQENLHSKEDLHRLLKSENRILDFILDNVLDGLLFWDLENPDNSWISPKLWSLLGYNPHEINDFSTIWKKIIEPEDLTIFHENIQKRLDHNQFVLDQEIPFNHKTNGTVWIHLKGVTAKIKDGKPIGLFFFSIDNTSHKNNELKLNAALLDNETNQRKLELVKQDNAEFQALNEELRSINEELLVTKEQALLSEKKLQLILGLAPDAFIQGDREGNIISINEKAIHLFGYTKEELLSMNFSQLFSQEDLMVNPPKFKTLKPHETILLERKAKRKDGTTLFVELNMKSMPDGTFQVFFRDVTERKQMAEALRVSQERLNLAIAVSNDGIWDWNLTTDTVYYDPQYYRLAGYEPDEFPHTLEEFYKRAHPDDFDYIMKEVENHLTGKSDRFEVEYRYLRKDGNYMWILGKGKIVARDREGNPLRFVGTHSDITERKKLTEELQTGRAYLQAVLDSVNDAVFVDDAETGTIIDVNERCCQMYGYSYEEMLRIPIGDLSQGDPPYSQQEAIQWLTKARIEGPQIFEWLAKRKNGALFWVEVNVHFAVIGGKNRFVVAVRDITERKLAADALQESEHKFRAIFENAGDAIFILGWEHFIDCNNKTLELFRSTRDEIIGSNPWEYSPEYQPEGIPSKIKALEKINAALQGEPQHFEWVHQRKDGTEIYTEVALSQLTIEGETYLQAIVRDVTDRKRAEEEIVQKNIFIQTLLNAIPLAVFYKDRDGKYLGCNRMFTEITGVADSELKGRTVYDVWPGEMAEKYHQMDMELMQKREHQEYEYKIKDKDGTERPVIYAKDVFYDTKGEVAGMVGAFLDISEIKRAEEALKKAKEKAEESDRLKTAFLQNMSHEIRTPLNAIMGFAELLPTFFDDKVSLQKFTKIIHQRSSDLLDIINDILDISKIESGQTTLNIENCNINQVFDELAMFFDEYKRKTDKEHIALYFNKLFDPTTSVIKTDRLKLRQILLNLIGNAFKYSVQGSIKCGYKKENNKLLFYVQDTGIGIPADKLETIFERFTRIETIVGENYVSGTGLGLPIVKGLVGLLGGEVWVESEENKGSTFYFTIEYIPAEQQPTEEKIIEDSSPVIMDKTILIVEDDFFNAEYLKAVLDKVATNIILVTKGMDAVRVVREQKVDLIMMDVRLPDITGYQAAELILNENPEMKIIAQTAYAEPTEQQRAREAGCVAYISKPMNPNAILSLVAKYISG